MLFPKKNEKLILNVSEKKILQNFNKNVYIIEVEKLDVWEHLVIVHNKITLENDIKDEIKFMILFCFKLFLDIIKLINFGFDNIKLN